MDDSQQRWIEKVKVNNLGIEGLFAQPPWSAISSNFTNN